MFLFSDAKNEAYGNQFFMWEMDDEVTNCRYCTKPFSLLNRKHHCRKCGGVYCANCTLSNVQLAEGKVDRCCNGCIRGELPGNSIREIVEEKLSVMDCRNGRKVNVVPIDTVYGALYDESVESTKSDSVPNCGYFEFVNKSDEFCCIKLISGDNSNEVSILWEIPRPSYVVVPPNGVVSARFDTTTPHLEVFILMRNAHTVNDSTDIVYDTKLHPLKLSPCAAVENFRCYLAFRVDCKKRNVILKLKMDDGGVPTLEPRLGTTISRIGVINKLKGGITGLWSSSSGSEKKVVNGNIKAEGGVVANIFDTNISASDITRLCASHRII